MKLDFYQHLEAIILKHLSKNNVNPELTLIIAPAIIDDVVHKFGGSMVYLKNQTQARTDEKHRMILADFNGTNQREVCQKYRITPVWLKKLLKRAAKSEEVE